MPSEAITLSVAPEAAQAFKAASGEARQKLVALVSLSILEATKTSESLAHVMLEISRRAQKRGLTPDILRSILDERA
jgi:hypothetical protein